MSEELENIEFDKHIRGKYADHGVLPSEKLWANINNNAAQLENNIVKKRLAFYQWLSIGLILLLVGTTIFYQFSTTKGTSQLPEKKTKQRSKKEISNVKIESITTESSTLNTVVAESNSSTFSEQNNQPNNIENTALSSSIATTKPKDETILADVENVDSYSTKNGKKIIEQPSNENRIPIKKQQKDNGLIPEIEKKESTNIDDNQLKKSIEINKEPILSQSLDDLSHFETEEEDKNKVSDVTAKVTINDLPEQSDIQDSSISDANANTLPESANTIATPPPIIPEKTLTRITVSALFLPTYSYRSLKAGDNASDFYNTNQSIKIQYNAGLNVGYNISDKFTVRLGINYTKLNNEYDLNDVRPEELPILMNPANKSITIYSSLATVVANNLDSFKFSGENEDDYELNDEGDFTSLSYKEEQKFTFLHLPVTIGHEFGKGKIKLVVDAGLVASFTIKSSSKIELTNVNNLENKVLIEDYHKTKSFNISGTIGVGAKYDLAKRVSLVIAPVYNYSFTNLNKDGSSTIKPYSINLSTGLQYRF